MMGRKRPRGKGRRAVAVTVTVSSAAARRLRRWPGRCLGRRGDDGRRPLSCGTSPTIARFNGGTLIGAAPTSPDCILTLRNPDGSPYWEGGGVWATTGEGMVGAPSLTTYGAGAEFAVAAGNGVQFPRLPGPQAGAPHRPLRRRHHRQAIVPYVRGLLVSLTISFRQSALAGDEQKFQQSVVLRGDEATDARVGDAPVGEQHRDAALYLDRGGGALGVQRERDRTGVTVER